MAPTKDKEASKPVVTTDHGEAGRVESDTEGNRVWRWAREVLDSTSILLKRLENKDLALEPTAKVPIVRGGKDAKKPTRGKQVAELSVEREAGKPDRAGGFDPYNRR